MLSWPDLYIPPAPSGVIHPDLSLFDSYKKVLIDIKDREVSIYVCGITPYDATHMGHAATYLTFDLIIRYLKASGKQVLFVENVTDIDDPLFERALRDGQRWQELGESQIELFREDMTALRVIPPVIYRGVVESMNEIISAISELINRGKTYYLDGDIYLDISKVKQLSDLPLPMDEALKIFKERGGDPEREGKRHSLDPLLWRARSGDDPYWPTPFGEGRPGWHIECTAIALKNLPKGEYASITLQGGGSDLIFPHHYMTALQAQGLNNSEFALCYCHTGMIGLDGEKMSKSKGNLVLVSELRKADTAPAAIRIALFLGHYSTDRMWSSELLLEAEEFLSRISSALSRQEVAPSLSVVQGIITALSNNLNTEKVFEILNNWCEETELGSSGGSPGEISRALDTYLGITL